MRMIRVLLVDDETPLLEVGQRFLEGMRDFSVTPAVSAPGAIRLLETEPFDAIVADYQMPVMDGIQFLLEVRKRFGHIPFILFTGRGREEVAIQAINNGADFYLQKGGEPKSQFAELAHKIRQAVGRYMAEQALRENEKRLVMAQEIGKIGSWEYNLKTDSIWGSAEGTRIYGLKQGAGDFPIGQIEACIPERERVHQALVDLIGKGKEYNLEFAINPADGTAQRVIHSMARLERDAAGNPLRVTGVIQDITDRKRAEERLRESEEKYRTIFEESFDGLFITTPEGKILDMNRKGIAMFGYATREEIQSLDLERDVYAYPRDRNRILAMVNARGTAEYEVVVKKKSGETMITYCSLTAVKDEKGAVTSYRGIIRDITDKKRAEEAIRESEKRYRSVIELNSAGYFRIDREGRYVDVNNAWLAMHKYSSKDEIIGQHFSETQVKTDLESAERIVKALLEGKTIPSGIFSRRCKDGSVGHHTFAANPVEQDGRIVGLEGFIIDIPECRESGQGM